MRLTLQSAPAAEPVSATEAKAHLRVDHSDDDTLIGSLITAAREHVENVTRRALITQTWDLYLDSFPTDISLPRPPLQSVSALTYVDEDGVTQTLSTSVYTVDTDAEPGRLYEAYGQVWPTVRSVEKAVKVRYVAGYGDAGTDVPQAIRQAMLLLIGHWYESREATASGNLSDLPFAVDALLSPYRVLRF